MSFVYFAVVFNKTIISRINKFEGRGRWPLPRLWLFCRSKKPNPIILLYIDRKKWSCFCSLTYKAGKTKRSNLTLLPLEIVYCRHTYLLLIEIEVRTVSYGPFPLGFKSYTTYRENGVSKILRGPKTPKRCGRFQSSGTAIDDWRASNSSCSKVWLICFCVLFFYSRTSFKYVSKFSSRDILHGD